MVLSSRQSERRSILNAHEVLKWCNSWRPNAGGGAENHAASGGGGDGEGKKGGGVIGARCIRYTFDDPLYSAALMSNTDVLIGVHGEDTTHSEDTTLSPAMMVHIWGVTGTCSTAPDRR